MGNSPLSPQLPHRHSHIHPQTHTDTHRLTQTPTETPQTRAQRGRGLTGHGTAPRGE
ncbi:unnamed protein product, partial [Lampetra planeri]